MHGFLEVLRWICQDEVYGFLIYVFLALCQTKQFDQDFKAY